MSESYGRGLDKGNVTALVEQNLKSVHFSGTLGYIAFNEEREVVTEVDILHVREGKVIRAGNYSYTSYSFLCCNVYLCCGFTCVHYSHPGSLHLLLE